MASAILRMKQCSHECVASGQCPLCGRKAEVEGDLRRRVRQNIQLIVRWELNLALREKIGQRAQQVEDALARLKEGEYGVCESCGRPIDPERLGVLPGTTLCIKCAREGKQDGKAPVADLAHCGR